MKSSRDFSAMQVKVGTLLAVAMSVTLLAMIFPTKGVNPLSPKIKLTAYFPAVAGLRASSPVWFSGVEVGSVDSVEFVPESDPPRLKVVMIVERKIQVYLKKDTRAVISGMGLLGDMYIDLLPGSQAAVQVQNGDVIPGVPAKDMKDDLNRIIASGAEMIKNLEQITADLNAGQGTIGRLLKDPAAYEELKNTVAELRRFVAALNNREGSAQKMLNDPALYDELTATVKDLHTVVNDIKQGEQKMLSEENRETLAQTIKTASRVVKRVGEYQEKVDKIKFDLSFGLNKYDTDLSSGHAQMQIWPTDRRYYQVGIRKASRLYGNETSQTTFDAQLAWRILDTPLYIRGGLMRNEYFVAGLDLRLFDDKFNLLLDTYRVEYNPAQLDLKAGVVFLDLLELTAGVEDLVHRPFYKAGLTIHYRDDDLITILMKSVF